MKFFDVDLKKEFPFLASKQSPYLRCFVKDPADRYAPERPVPAMLVIPGGGYSCVCYDREGEPIAFHYLSAGYSVFSLFYSVAPEHYPQQMLEAAAAMLYVRKHAAEFGIDPDRIAVNGYSAGGHLAASLGVFWNDPLITDTLGVSGKELRPNALVLGYPVISADPSFAHMGSIYNVTGTQDVNSPIFQKMSLEKQVNAETPPTFIWHTAEDKTVSPKNSIAFASALAENNVAFELHIYPYGWHGLATADPVTNIPPEAKVYYCRTWMDESIKFLDELWKE